MEHKKSFTAILRREDDGWIASCPELDIASQGDTDASAKANLQEAVKLFLESASPAEIQAKLRAETYLTPLEVSLG